MPNFVKWTHKNLAVLNFLRHTYPFDGDLNRTFTKELSLFLEIFAVGTVQNKALKSAVLTLWQAYCQAILR